MLVSHNNNEISYIFVRVFEIAIWKIAFNRVAIFNLASLVKISHAKKKTVKISKTANSRL